MRIKRKKIILLCLACFFLILFPLLIAAYDTQVKWPRSPVPPHRELSTSTVLHEFVAYFYEWGIALGGLVVFVVLVYAGFKYLTSAGNPTKMADAMDRIKAAVLGLVLLLSSWLILSIINPELVTLKEIKLQPPIGDPDDPDELAQSPQGRPCDRVVLCDKLSATGTCAIVQFDFDHQKIKKVEEDDLNDWPGIEGFRSGYSQIKNPEPPPAPPYIKGGVCSIAFFEKAPWWQRADNCATIIGDSDVNSNDFALTGKKEGKVSCFEIMRTPQSEIDEVMDSFQKN